jgi:serine/threonine-protein kinase
MVLDRASECLDEETIAAFVAGALDPVALSRVESHVSRCAACQTVIADAAYGAIGRTGMSRVPRAAPESLAASGEVAKAPASTRWETPLPQPGEVLAEKYRVEKVLGQGGMGTVLSAFHVELGHRVAIKLLHYGGAAAAARFLREAQTCAKLGNDHIVRAFDVGRLAGGAPYLVMEYLIGEDLSRLIARGPVPIADAVRYVLEACEALASAHAAGIVHRDLKPANLFLTARPSGRPTIKLLDFGISKIVGNDGEESGFTLTSTGAVLGFPLYMSPEQIRASKGIDGRTDIWSLGVILYELLTGRPPFHAPSLSALSVAIATEAPVLPTTFRPEIGRELEAIVLCCLRKERTERFATVAELAQALTPFGSGSASQPALPAAEPASKPASKSRAGAVVAGIAAALVVGGAGVAFVATRNREAPDPEPSAAAVAEPPRGAVPKPEPRAGGPEPAPSVAPLATTDSVRPSVTPAPSDSAGVKPKPNTAVPARPRLPRVVAPPVPARAPKPDPTGSPD